jgi:hypothetical protein
MGFDGNGGFDRFPEKFFKMVVNSGLNAATPRVSKRAAATGLIK